jgi:hypothetical protein
MASTDKSDNLTCEIIYDNLTVIWKLSLFCKNYRFSKTALYITNRKIHGCLEIPDLFLMLNMISHLFARSLVRYHVQHMHTLYFINYAKYFNTDKFDCNNLQNSYVLRILCFGERVIGWVWGVGVRNISSPLRGVLNIFRLFWGVPNLMVEFWNPPPPQYTYFMTGPLDKWKKTK